MLGSEPYGGNSAHFSNLFLKSSFRQIIGGQSEEFCLRDVAAFEDNASLCLAIGQVKWQN